MGEELGGATSSVSFGPLTATDFVRYAGAGGDFTPTHHDDVYARSHGYRSVFAMGLFTAGLMASSVIETARCEWLRSFDIRFVEPVWPGETLHVFSAADVADRADRGPLLVVRAVNEIGVLKAHGTAQAGGR